MPPRDYTVADIKRYIRHRLNDDNDLFEFDFQTECRGELDDLCISRESGAGILFSFASIAGGWQTSVGRRLVGDGFNSLGLDDDFRLISETDLEKVEEKGYGGHPHRHAHGAHPRRALNALSTLSQGEVDEFDGRRVRSPEAVVTTI